MEVFRLFRAVRRSLWFVPLSYFVAGIVLAIGTTTIDRHYGYSLISTRWTGTADDVRVVLSTFASSLITLTGLVLTMTLVVVQLAMGQFSPRIIRSLLENNPSQIVIGIFGATFVQSVITIRQVDVGRTGPVPGLSVLVAYAMMLGCLVALVLYIHRVGRGLRVSSLIEIVGSRARKLLDAHYPADENGVPTQDDDGTIVLCRWAGVLFKVDYQGLVDAARRADCVLELVPAVGDFVPGGAPLFRLHGADPAAIDKDDLLKHLVLGNERTLSEDFAYSIRLLVDIALRALSPAMNDPTTAIQVIHRLHDLLRHLATRPFPGGDHFDAEGRLRLITRTLDWDGYVRLAFDEIRIYGASSLQIPRRLRHAIEDVKSVAPPERHAALDRQLKLLGAAVERELPTDEEPRPALVPDSQGLGSGRDLVGIRSEG